MNRSLALKILNELIAKGVKTLCLCPGGRNAPFVELLAENSPFEVISFFDERSAGFFACGRIKRDGNPVAVLTTSGTAVSELLSPVIEAWYSRLPMVVVTSDRPRRLRGSGAPQAIEQTDIFGSYVERSIDIEIQDEWESVELTNKPFHINVCFDEPLIEAGEAVKWENYPAPKTQQANGAEKIPWVIGKSLCVVGALASCEQKAVEKWLTAFEGPIFLEASSGLRGGEVNRRNILSCSDRMVQEVLKIDSLDSVLRLGDVPLGRYWRDFDQLKIPVFSASNKPWAGVENGKVITQSLEKLDLSSIKYSPWLDSELEAIEIQNQTRQREIDSAMAQFPLSEVALFGSLQNSQEQAHSIYIGNSLPIRNWDMVSKKQSPLYFNRGANGIDGQISSAFGSLEPGKMHWAIFGDLTTLYDMSAFWMTSKLREMDVGLNLFVVNNFGGQIFSRLFKNPLFRNEHSVRFQKLAEMWDWNYQSWEDGIGEIPESGLNLIELVPDKTHEAGFQEIYEGIWQ